MSGMELKVERVRRRLRQWRVALALELPPSELSKIENYEKSVSERFAETYLSILDKLSHSPVKEMRE